MPLSVFPAVVAGTSSINAFSVTVASPNVLNSATRTFLAAIYTITCASGTIAKVEFFSNATTPITLATTASGTVTINLATDADRIRVWTDTGSSVVVTITKTADALTNNISGTLDTIIANTTYTGTSTSGFGYVVVVGGGGGGGASSGLSTGGLGGAAGQVIETFLPINGSPITVTIGTAGNGGSGGGVGTAGTSTTFGATTATGGAAGILVGGLNGGAGGGTASTRWTFIANPIGAGGAEGAGFAGAVGSGRGSGGGGATTAGNGSWAGAAGRGGAVYVLRF